MDKFEGAKWWRGVEWKMDVTSELSFVKISTQSVVNPHTSQLYFTPSTFLPDSQKQSGFSLPPRHFSNCFSKVTDALFIAETFIFSVLIFPDLRKPRLPLVSLRVIDKILLRMFHLKCLRVTSNSPKLCLTNWTITLQF